MPEAASQVERLTGVFDRAADTSDDVGVDFFQPIAELLVRELAPRPGERCLDIGCGRGAALLRLAEAVGAEGRAVGLDLAPRMVEQAARAVAAAGLAAEVRIGDAQAPDERAGSYDVVASSLVLFFLPDPGAALRAWRELLVDGGRLGVTTFGPYTTNWQQVEAVFAPYLPADLRDARTTGRAGPFASDAGVEQLLTAAGLRDVRTVTATVSARFDDEEHWHRWTWSVGHRAMWEAIPEEQRPAALAEAYAVLDGCRDAEGRIGFDQVVRCTLGRR